MFKCWLFLSDPILHTQSCLLGPRDVIFPDDVWFHYLKRKTTPADLSCLRPLRAKALPRPRFWLAGCAWAPQRRASPGSSGAEKQRSFGRLDREDQAGVEGRGLRRWSKFHRGSDRHFKAALVFNPARRRWRRDAEAVSGSKQMLSVGCAPLPVRRGWGWMPNMYCVCSIFTDKLPQSF